MTVTADAKKRVFLPPVKPGDRFYMRAKSNSPSPAQRQGQAGVSERSFLSSAERRAEARFRRLAAKGNPARGRQFLAEIQRRLAGAKRIDDQQTSGEQTRVERKGFGLAEGDCFEVRMRWV